MDRIYEVKIEGPYDYNVYFVKAGDIGTAASLALQADAASPAGQALRAERKQGRVKSVTDFCSPEQFVG